MEYNDWDAIAVALREHRLEHPGAWVQVAEGVASRSMANRMRSRGSGALSGMDLDVQVRGHEWHDDRWDIYARIKVAP